MSLLQISSVSLALETNVDGPAIGVGQLDEKGVPRVTWGR